MYNYTKEAHLFQYQQTVPVGSHLYLKVPTISFPHLNRPCQWAIVTLISGFVVFVGCSGGEIASQNTDSDTDSEEDPDLIDDCELEEIEAPSADENSISPPPGYTFCAVEGGTTFLLQLSDLAYGADGSYEFLENQTGEITFSKDLFGDPAPGKTKAGFCRPVTDISTTELASAMGKLREHINNTAPLDPNGINAQAEIIKANIHAVGADEQILKSAFDVVKLYEKSAGPLFVNDQTKNGIPRTPTGGLELARALLALQQGIMDFGYTPLNVHQLETFNAALFETSSYFPGSVSPPADPSAYGESLIDASHPTAWGWPVMYETMPARRPTGFYVAPGSVATVVVPEAVVNKGYLIRVGAHSWDLEKKPTLKRLDRVSLVYPILCRKTHVANPLGGGIYIEVPYEAKEGILTVKIANAVRSPLFSATKFARTTKEQWENTERKHPGPFADFVSDKFMMQVPTSWIYNSGDPTAMMADWDLAMDAVSELFGFPLIRSKTVLYMQVDVVIRGSAFYPGYPQSNHPYNPTNTENGNSNHWLVKGPRYSDSTTFHELGHAQLFTKFSGETEAVVNFLYVSVHNKKFGVDLDTAFGNSFKGQSQISLEQAAIQWMVRPNFRDGKPMDITNSESNEVRYQHKGYGKYAEIVRLFGWEALEKFWSSVQEDYIAGITYSRNNDPTDNRILRMSRAAGADLTPLIHFWGVHPENRTALRADIKSEGIPDSAAIYDRLVYYKSIIPMNNQAFQDHANLTYPNGISDGHSPLYGEGWYYVWLPKYDTTHGTAAVSALEDIIDLYFPDGRP